MIESSLILVLTINLIVAFCVGVASTCDMAAPRAVVSRSTCLPLPGDAEEESLRAWSEAMQEEPIEEAEESQEQGMNLSL